MTALYELALQYRDAAEKLADMSLDEATVADTLESMSGDFESKATNVAMFTRNLRALSAAIKDAETQMAARRKATDARAASIERYLLESMVFAGIGKIEGPHFRLAVRDNPPAVEVFDVAQVPAEFMRTPEPPPPSPDKAAIRDAIKAGTEVPGARMTQSQRLEWR